MNPLTYNKIKLQYNFNMQLQSLHAQVMEFYIFKHFT